MTAVNSVIWFNVLSVFFFVIAPFDYYSVDPFFVALYVLLNISFLKVGHSLGFKGRAERSDLLFNRIQTAEKKFHLIIFYFYLFFFTIRYSFLLKFGVFDFFAILNFLSAGVVDPQFGYSQSLLIAAKPETIHWIFGIFVLVLTGVYFPLMFVSWSFLSAYKKTAVVFFTFLEILYWLGRGTNFGFIFILLFIFYSMIIANKFKIDKRHAFKFAVPFLFSLFVFLFNISARSDYEYADVNSYAFSLTSIDSGHPLFWLFDSSLHAPLLVILSYLVQGYYHMGLAFDMSFDFTFLGGWNSTLLTWYSNFGLSVDDLTYLRKLEYLGVDEKVNWHSAYTWFANDVSFYFVPFVILLYGYILGWSQRISMKYNSIIAKVLFLYLSIGSIFFFANTNFLSYFLFSIFLCFFMFFYFGLFSRGEGR